MLWLKEYERGEFLSDRGHRSRWDEGDGEGRKKDLVTASVVGCGGQ